MKNLTLNEQQEIYGGGFEEGREIGHAIGSTLTGALALFGAYVFFKGFIPIVYKKIFVKACFNAGFFFFASRRCLSPLALKRKSANKIFTDKRSQRGTLTYD